MPIIDETGKITGYKTTVGGADTVFPFSNGKDALYEALQYSGLVTPDMTFEQMLDVLKAKYPDEYNILLSNSFTSTGDVTRDGFSFGVDAVGGKKNKSGTFYSNYFDLTNYKILKLSGSIYCMGPDPGEWGKCTLYLQSASGVNTSIGTKYQGAGSSAVQLSNYDITQLTGSYRLYGVLETYNGQAKISIGSAILSNN